MSSLSTRRYTANGDANKLQPEDRRGHDWYRFVLSFPPHLVRDYLRDFGLSKDTTVLDPFCGTGTTVLECKKVGVPSVGVEAHPMACLAGRVKLDWSPDSDRLLAHAQDIADLAHERLRVDGVDDDLSLRLRIAEGSAAPLRTLPAEIQKLLLTDSISPRPLHKVLTLLDCLQSERDDRYYRHERVALATALVNDISNLHFGPEVGVGPAREDAPAVGPWLNRVAAMSDDLRVLQHLPPTRAEIYQMDSRRIHEVLSPNSVDAVITSPPYPNEKDYTRTTRLESVLLGLISDKEQLRALKRGLVRSNTRSVYKEDDDDRWIRQHPEIERIATAIEARRVELGKTSGFERMYGRVTRLYFGGMARHLESLRSVLRPGALLAYVVGDQASYLRVMIRTGQLLGQIALGLGYELVRIDLFRTRLATATREQLREEVVVLRWPGPHAATANGKTQPWVEALA